MAHSSIGLIEVEGYSVALAALNVMEKTTHIRVLAIDCNNPKDEKNAEIPMTVQVIFQGSVSDVEEALRVGQKEALKYVSREVISVELISRHAEGLMSILTSGKVTPQYELEEFKHVDISMCGVSAIGVIEVQHYTNALLVMNDLLQKFSIQYEHHEIDLGGRLITLVFSGSVSQVSEACKFIEENQSRYHKKVFTSIPISYPTKELLRYILGRKDK